MSEDERVGIEGIAFSPRVISKAEVDAILRIMNAPDALPVPGRTTVDEDATGFLSSLDERCPNCGEPLLVARYGTCRKCGARTDLDTKTGQIGQRDQGDEREE